MVLGTTRLFIHTEAAARSTKGFKFSLLRLRGAAETASLGFMRRLIMADIRCTKSSTFLFRRRAESEWSLASEKNVRLKVPPGKRSAITMLRKWVDVRD
jgi:hypothetical protein